MLAGAGVLPAAVWAVCHLRRSAFQRPHVRLDDDAGVVRCAGPRLGETDGKRRLRRFYGTVLAFTALEYALWTASCFWVSDTLTNPYFWFDFLLTLVLLLFLPAVRKAVTA